MAVNRDNPDAQRPVLRCGSCDGKYRVPPGGKGQVLRCPHCGRSIRSGAPETPDTAASRPPATRPLHVADTIEADPLDDLEVRRKPVPVPPLPMWSGVYSFPWQASGLRAWFFFGFGLSVVALMGAGVHYVIDLYQASDAMGAGSIWYRVGRLFVAGLMTAVIWTGTFAGSFFLATIEETAAGNPKVGWPDDSIPEKFFRFLGLVWVFLCAAFPLGLIATLIGPYLGYAVVWWSFALSGVVVFPFVLLCGLASGSWYLLWSQDVVVSMVQRPLVWLTFYMMSGLLFCLCLGLGYPTVMDYGHFLFLAPVTGFVWSACLLIYGRLLGRVAWVITGEHERTERMTRRLKKGRRRQSG